MSNLVFRKPPLIHIAAEVRWELTTVETNTPGPRRFPVPVGIASHEIQFMTFAGKAGAKGFSIVERVIPPGLPFFAHQIAYRYRNPNSAVSGPLFQLGPGIFSVEMVPPYKSWDSFVPHIRQGLELLDESWPAGQTKSFTAARLRYVDAFSEEHRQGKSTLKFLAENLGIRISLPEVLTKVGTNNEAVQSTFSVVIPIHRGALELKVNEGWHRNARALIMQTMVSINEPFAMSQIVPALDEAHRIINESFVAMTEPMHAMMEPEVL